MSQNCSVVRSKFCDMIIAMRLEGHSLRKIAAWLKEQGMEYIIPAATIDRNLKSSGVNLNLPYGEELAETWGGDIEIDVARELARSILIQRKRIDRFVRLEDEISRTKRGHVDRRIKGEITVLNRLIDSFQALLDDPMEAAKRLSQVERDMVPTVEMSEESERVMTDLILKGGLSLKHPSEKIEYIEIPQRVKKRDYPSFDDDEKEEEDEL